MPDGYGYSGVRELKSEPLKSTEPTRLFAASRYKGKVRLGDSALVTVACSCPDRATGSIAGGIHTV